MAIKIPLCPMVFCSVLAVLSASQLLGQTSPLSTSSSDPDKQKIEAALRADLQATKDKLSNYAELSRYSQANAELPALQPTSERIVMFGDSITDNWQQSPALFFPNQPYVDRGIRGQNTSQMLLRFRADVLDLKPSVVVILAGTNDIAGRADKPGVIEAAEDNLRSMTELAQHHNVRVVLSTLLPVCKSQIERRNPADILAFNSWIREYASSHHATLLDYFPALLDPKTGQLKEKITNDCLHPNAEGYRIMEPLAEQAVAAALKDR